NSARIDRNGCDDQFCFLYGVGPGTGAVTWRAETPSPPPSPSGRGGTGRPLGNALPFSAIASGETVPPLPLGEGGGEGVPPSLVLSPFSNLADRRVANSNPISVPPTATNAKKIARLRNS